MPSINGFIDHCLEDAKVALRQLDPEFVSEHENTVRLQNLGTSGPMAY